MGKGISKTMVQALVLAAAAGCSEANTLDIDVAGEPRTSPPFAGDAGPGVWISREELVTRPTSGAAWDHLKAAADDTCGPPDLSNQDDPTNVCVLAKALVFARIGGNQYRDAVVAALRSVTNSGTYNGRALALGRELASYPIAAGLIDLESHDPALDHAFRAKLRELRTTYADGGGVTSLIECHERRPNNWGLHCGATRASIAVYLGDAAELARTVQVFKGYLGDRSAYAGFEYGDLSWQCDPNAPVGINRAGCTKDGHSIDGVLPDDQRRCGAFSSPPCLTNYAWEGLQGALVLAWILHRQGHDAFNWSDRALLRAVRWLLDEARFPAEGDDTWLLHIVNYVYGSSFSAPVPAQPGKALGWTDWTHKH